MVYVLRDPLVKLFDLLKPFIVFIVVKVAFKALGFDGVDIDVAELPFAISELGHLFALHVLLPFFNFLTDEVFPLRSQVWVIVLAIDDELTRVFVH